MKKDLVKPASTMNPMDLSYLDDVTKLSDADPKSHLEEAGCVLPKVYQASKDYICRKIADTCVLISVNANRADFSGYIEINETGLDLWNRLQEPCQLHDLEEVLENKYEIAHDKVVEDVIDFINQLIALDMVVMK